MDNYIFGRNNVIELLKDGKRSVSKLILMKNMKDNSKIDHILDLARERGVVFQFQPKEKFTQFKEYAHQGVIAYVSPVKYIDLDDFLSKEKNDYKRVIVADGVEDPHPQTPHACQNQTNRPHEEQNQRHPYHLLPRQHPPAHHTSVASHSQQQNIETLVLGTPAQYRQCF